MASSLTSGRPTSLAGVGNKPSAIIPAGGGEFYDCKRFCAMFDKPYIARYERKAGKLFFVGTFKNEASAGKGKGKRPSVALRFDELKTSIAEERCAWCGVKDFVSCGNCSEFVCRAHVSKRDGGLHFRCRASCQNEAMLEGTVETFEASKPVGPSRIPGGRAAVPPGKGTAAALPAPAGQLRLKA